MGDSGDSAVDPRVAELQWLQEQVASSDAFSPEQTEFVCKELKVNPDGAGFVATSDHMENSVFRNRLGANLAAHLPPFHGRKLSGISKKKNEPYLFFKWDEAPSDPQGHPPFEVLERDDDYRELIERIRNKAVKKVLLIQHWGQSTATLRDYLLQHTQAEIELYIQSPKGACCKSQREKIKQFIKEFRRDARQSSDSSTVNKRVQLFTFDVRASLRAVLIDDTILEIAWYLYYPGEEGEIEIKGRILPTIYATSDWEGFSRLKRVVGFWESEVKPKCRRIFPEGESGGAGVANTPGGDGPADPKRPKTRTPKRKSARPRKRAKKRRR